MKISALIYSAPSACIAKSSLGFCQASPILSVITKDVLGTHEGCGFLNTRRFGSLDPLRLLRESNNTKTLKVPVLTERCGNSFTVAALLVDFMATEHKCQHYWKQGHVFASEEKH